MAFESWAEKEGQIVLATEHASPLRDTKEIPSQIQRRLGAAEALAKESSLTVTLAEPVMGHPPMNVRNKRVLGFVVTDQHEAPHVAISIQERVWYPLLISNNSQRRIPSRQEIQARRRIAKLFAGMFHEGPLLIADEEHQRNAHAVLRRKPNGLRLIDN